MQQFLQYLLYAHIAAGSCALLTGPIAMLNQNGNKLHRNAGKIFFYSMSLVFISAVIISIAHSNTFLLIIAFFSYQLISVATRSIYLKKLHLNQKPALIDWFISIVSGLFNMGLVTWGGWVVLVLKDNFGFAALIFGFFGIQFLIADVKRFIKKPTDKNHWLYLHISGMIGGYIATSTAFLVNVVHSDYPLIVWLTPVAIFYPFLIYTNRKFKNRFKKGKQLEEIATIKIN